MGTEDRGPGTETRPMQHQPRHLQGLRHPRPLSKRDRRDDGETDRPGIRQLPEGVAHRRVTRHARLVASAGCCVHRGCARAGSVGRRLRHAPHRRALLRRRHRQPRGRRADHRVAQSEAVQRHQDGALRGAAAQRRCGHRRHSRHDCQRSPAGTSGDARRPDEPRRAARLRREGDVVHRSLDHQAVQRRPGRRQRHGRTRGATALRTAALPHDEVVLRG